MQDEGRTNKVGESEMRMLRKCQCNDFYYSLIVGCESAMRMRNVWGGLTSSTMRSGVTRVCMVLNESWPSVDTTTKIGGVDMWIFCFRYNFGRYFDILRYVSKPDRNCERKPELKVVAQIENQ